jgi:exodeoxyribonuclease-3
MIITSWNVNGLRSIANKGLEEWFKKIRPDVIALQEIKAQEKDVVALLKIWGELYDIYLYPAKRPGYSGTALFILKKNKQKVISVTKGIGIPEFDNEGRLIWAEFENVS